MNDETTKIDEYIESIKESIFETLDYEFKESKYESKEEFEEEVKTEHIRNLFLDNLYMEIDSHLIYYHDQDNVIAQYGLNSALHLYKDEYGTAPENAGQIAYCVLQRVFWEKYSEEELFENYIESRWGDEE